MIIYKSPLKLKFCILFLLCITLILFSFNCGQQDGNRIQYMKSAKKLYNSGNIDEAISNFEKASAYKSLAVIFSNLNEYDTALKYLNKISERSQEIDYLFGQVYYLKNELEEARKYFLLSLQHNTFQIDQERIYFRLAKIYEETGKHQEAITYYKYILQRNPNIGFMPPFFNIENIINIQLPNPDMAYIYYSISKNYNAIGKYHEAIQYGEAILFNNPIPDIKEEVIKALMKLPPPINLLMQNRTYLLLASLYNKVDQYGKAENMLQKFEEKCSHNEMAHNLQYIIREREIAKIKQTMRKYALSDRIDQYHVLAEYYILNKDLYEALNYYQKIINIDPLNKKTSLGIGKVKLLKGEYHEAINIFIDILKNDPLYEDAYFLISLCHYRLKNYQDAIRYSKILTTLNNKHKESFNIIGISNYKLKNYSIANDYFQESLKIEPKDPLILLYNGLSFYHQNKYFEALENLNSCAKYNTSDELNEYLSLYVRKIKASINGDIFISRKINSIVIPIDY